MKQLLFFHIVFVMTFSGHSQYIGFPDTSASWSVFSESYWLTGDSVFDSKTYNIVYRNLDSSDHLGSYFALYRDDTILKKTYAIAENDSVEKLIYDFSLTINDTVTVYPISFINNQWSVKIKVLAIDSILIGNAYHKQLQIDGWNQSTGIEEFWIEGVGSTMGMFNAGITGIGIFDIIYPELLCFHKSDTLVYQNPVYETCYLKVSVDILDPHTLENANTKAYPNPLISKVLIKSNEEIQNGTIEISGLTGTLILNESFKGTSKELDLSTLNAGVYICTIKENNAIIDIIRLLKE